MTTLETPADPVAWMYDWYADGIIVADWVSRDYDEAHSPTMGCHNIRPLYVRPQQAEWQEVECPCCGELARAFPPAPAREWVGLTDDEIFGIHKQVDSMQYLTFGKAIEAALKEKNI
jgi:hypothetical protein